MRANEPGNRLYERFESSNTAGSYTLIEIYEDEAAIAAHRTSSHMAANRPLTAPFLAAPPVMHVFTVVPHSMTDRRSSYSVMTAVQVLHQLGAIAVQHLAANGTKIFFGGK